MADQVDGLVTGPVEEWMLSITDAMCDEDELCPTCLTRRAFARHVDRKLERYERTIAVVVEQAQDDGLWFRAQTAPEAYLQQELRRLHRAVEQ